MTDVDTRIHRRGSVVTVRMTLSDEHGTISVRRALDLATVTKPGVRYDAVRSEPEKYIQAEARAELNMHHAKRELQAGRCEASELWKAKSAFSAAVVRCGRDTEE